MDASEEEIAQAVKLAHLEQVIDQMPEGLETVIGERGSNFLVVKSNG